MIEKIARRMRDEDSGFTLIELMVVVLIIGILIAIALPTFLGARQRAQNRAAQSSLRNALVAAKTAYTDNDNYSTANAAGLTAIEPSLTFLAGTAASTGPNVVSVTVAAGAGTVASPQQWQAAALSDSGNCYWIRDAAAGATAGTFYGAGTPCTGDAAAGATGTRFP